MAVELDSIIARLKANTSNMRRGFNQMVTKARDATKSIGDSFQRLGKRVQTIGKKMALSITAPFAALIGFSIKAASDVQELENLIAVTFGKATKDVTDWSVATARATNRSSDALLKAAGDFAAFLKPLGVAPERIVPMSKALSQLTTDLGSFRNIVDEVALIRLFSGIAGEPEAVRRLGIDLGEKAIQAELVRLGFEGVATSASQAQKVIARYNLIIKQTTDAQGDAARTILSFENQMKGLVAVIRDIRIAIGNQLLPVATELVNKISKLGRRFLDLTDESQRNILVYGGIAAAIGPVLILFGLFIQVIGFAISGLVMFANAAVKSVGFVLTAFKNLAVGVFKAVRLIVTSIFTIPGIVAVSIAAAIAALLLFPATLREIFNINALSAILDNFRVAFQNSVIDPTFKMLNNLFVNLNLIPGIELDLIKLAPPAKIREDTKEFAANLSNIFQEELTRVKGQLSSAIDSVAATFGDLLPDSIKKALDKIKGINVDMSALFKIDEAKAGLNAFKSELEDVFKTFSDLGANAGDVLDDNRLKAKDLAEDLRQAFIGRLADINSFGDAMTAVFDRLKAQLLEIAFFGTTGTGGLFGGIFGKIGEGVAAIFGGGKAAGGPVQPRRAFLVGERGPEMFVPQAAGNIVNASSTATASRARGDIHITQIINLPPDNAEITDRMFTIGAAMRDQAVSAMRQAQNTGF